MNSFAGLSEYTSFLLDKFKETSMFADMTEVLDQLYPELWDIEAETNIWELGVQSRDSSPDLNVTWNTPKTLSEIHDSFKVTSYHMIKVWVKFPEVTLTNTREESHTIKDLYVGFRIKVLPQRNGNLDFEIENDIEGFRTQFSREEYESKYTHSHLGTIPKKILKFKSHIYESLSGRTLFRYWNSNIFCTGNGPITRMLLELSTGWDKNLFKLICIHLKQYIAHESIEGGPYIYINQISLNNLQRPGDLSYELIPVEEIKKIIREYKPAITFKKDGQVRVHLNADKKTLIELGEAYGFPKCVMSGNSLRVPGVIENTPEIVGPVLFHFRGEPLRVKIDSFEQNEEIYKEQNFHPNPKFKQSFTNEAEHFIQKIKDKVYFGFKNGNTSYRDFRPEKENPVFVSEDRQSGVVRDSVLQS